MYYSTKYTNSSSTTSPYSPSTMGGGRTPTQISSKVTSAAEGISLEEMEMIWKNLTASEMCIKMMDRLQKYKVGYSDSLVQL